MTRTIYSAACGQHRQTICACLWTTLSVFLLSFFSLSLIGCGSAAQRNSGEPGASISILPNGVSLQSGMIQQFTVTAQNIGNPTVTWSASAGTISQDGLFTAPAVSSVATVTIKGASSNDESVWATAVVTVQPTPVLAPPLAYKSCAQATLDGLGTLQLPPALPFGGLTGSNNLVDDPEPLNQSSCLHNSMLRVTDAATEPAHPNFSFFAGGGGSADTNAWSRDSSMFVLQDSGGRTLMMNFNPATMQVYPIYGQNSYNLTLLKVAYGSWSYTLPGYLYAYENKGTAIEQIEFTNHSVEGATGPSSVTTIGDFQGIDRLADGGSPCLQQGEAQK